jgi:hypothetical protein
MKNNFRNKNILNSIGVYDLNHRFDKLIMIKLSLLLLIFKLNIFIFNIIL